MTPTRAPERYVAFLRGINVSGKNIVPMKDLAAICQRAGCGEVRTYIQSGNVIFTAQGGSERKLCGELSRRIEEHFGFKVPLVIRTREELRAAIEANRFLTPSVDPKTLYVYFLAETPSKEAVATLDPNRSAPDAFTVHGREVYLHLPNGMARTKLTNAWLDSRLKTVSTARNWNTVLKLSQLMDS